MKKELREEIDKIINVPREADFEYSKIVENTTRKKTQYRTTIPKKFAEAMKLNKDEYQVKFSFFNEGTPKNPIYKLTAEVVKIK